MTEIPPARSGADPHRAGGHPALRCPVVLLRPRPRPAASQAGAADPPAPGRRFALLLGALLATALGLRLWSIGHGLPFVFNPDEELHFVSRAVNMFEGSLNPNYFENPPALTYALFVIFKVAFTAGFPFGGGAAFVREFADDPEPVFLVARVVVALIGTLVVALVVWAGTRFYDRRVGLVAGAVLAFAFLPAFYSKQALNDVVTLVPVTLALIASLAVLRRGRPRDYVLAGAVLGAACATKYTAGAMVVTLLGAALLRVLERRERPLHALGWLAAAGIAFTAAFLLIHPYSVVEFDRFRGAVSNQSGTAGQIVKLGQADVPGWVYYAWTLTWGLGWAPLAAALAGAVLALRADRRRALLLLAFPVLLFLFLGAQARYFGRWYLPAYPMLAILAGLAAVRIADLAPRRALRPVLLSGLTALLVLQGLVSDVRVNTVLGQTDTRALARTWLGQNVPQGSRIVVEPFLPEGFLTTGGRSAPPRYERFPVSRPFQEYEFRLGPALPDLYRRQGYCWVVTASYQKQRGLEAGLANARAYYRRLERVSTRQAVFSPYRFDEQPVRFSFDLSFNFLPKAYGRPGPVIEVHRLNGCPPGPAA